MSFSSEPFGHSRKISVPLKNEIHQTAIDRNKVWIDAVTNSLGQRNETALIGETMKAAGQKCADQILEMTIAHFGRVPETVDELIEAIVCKGPVKAEIMKSIGMGDDYCEFLVTFKE